jgi:hypothetical protein
MRTLLDLGTQPLVNNLCNTEEEALNAEQFELKAVIEDDLTIRLNSSVDPEKLYSDYLYKSGVGAPYRFHCANMFRDIKSRSLKYDTIVDIGGNDGTLLRSFQSESDIKLNMYNVDASSSFREENENSNINYTESYWNRELDLPKADLIVSTNVFQHTPDVHKFLGGIQEHLNGVWILEFPYTLRTLETNQFDQFYHEHYYYWLITPLRNLFSSYGLTIIDLVESTIHGGTMRIYSSNLPTAVECTEKLDHYCKLEQDFDYANFTNIVSHISKSSGMILDDQKLFFGAAAKGCVFLNAMGISSIDYDAVIVDDTVGKQNKYMPGTGFKIVSREEANLSGSKENLTILAHNYRKYLIDSLRLESYFTGNIYTFLPTLEVNTFG